MIPLLKKSDEGYWRKSDTFLLPLTGLPNNKLFNMKSYLFWNDYGVDNYQLILTFDYEEYDQFIRHLKTNILPYLDKNSCILESYDYENKSVFVLDMSEWAIDIEMFMVGKYSKLSREAKLAIEKFYLNPATGKLTIQIWGILYPHSETETLDNMTALDYMIKGYGLDAQAIRKIGEVGSIFDREQETLVTDVAEPCQYDTELV